MTIYTKLQEARARLHKLELKKSGYNNFSKYYYFELGDFLPQVQDIFNAVGLCPVFDFSGDTHVKLHIHDTESDAVITFSSPMADAGVKGATAIQAVGSSTTYQRRYLYLQALEITENDIVYSLDAKDKKTPDAKPTANEQKQACKESPQPDYAAILVETKTLQELGLAWQTVPNNIKPGLTELKDSLKAYLTPKTEETDWKILIADAEDMDALTAIYRSMSPAQQEQYNVDIDYRSSELQGDK
jgi:ERF superfamily